MVASKDVPRGKIIMENDPIIAIVDQLNSIRYCSWCMKANNPRPTDKQDDGSDPDSFVPYVKLRSCSRCQFTMYCSQECQKAHWADHKPECDGKILQIMPTSLRFLLQVMRLKTDSTRKDFMKNLTVFNKKILGNMTSMAQQVV